MRTGSPCPASVRRFYRALAVVGDQDIGGVQNMAVRAIVLLQLDQILHLEFMLERRHIADVGAAECVNALVIITDRKHCAFLACHQLEPFVLQIIGVLKLIHQNVLETGLIMFTQWLVARQQFIRAQQQFGEIDHAFALALLIVQIVELHELAVVVIVGIHILGPQALVFGAIDEVHQIARRILFVIDIVCLEQTLDGRQLILRIENLECLRQTGIAMMRPQQTIAQPVKGPDPHAARIDRQHRRQPRQHFLGGLVGKCHCQQTGR